MKPYKSYFVFNHNYSITSQTYEVLLAEYGQIQGNNWTGTLKLTSTER